MTNPKISRSIEDLHRELQEQISLIESSVIGFFEGRREEAKRIATSLRLLLHDTNSSRSLLKLLSVKDKLWFFDVAHPYDGRNILSEDLLLNWTSPIIEATSLTPRKKFDDWWENQVVITTNGSNLKTFSRKQIVLFLANQDGGAHVDPEIDADYYEMTRNNKYGWVLMKDGTEEPLSNDRFKLSVITIAFEVCETLHRSNSSLSFRLFN